MVSKLLVLKSNDALIEVSFFECIDSKRALCPCYFWWRNERFLWLRDCEGTRGIRI